MKKRIFALLLAGAMIFGLAACSNGDTKTSTTPDSQTSTTPDDGGATGGTDVVAAWVRKKRPEASLVWLIFALNSSVAVLSFFVYGCQFEPVIMCLVYCFLSSRISDAMLKGGKRALKFEVITKDAEALAAQLIRELRHSVTMLPALGMYTKQEYSLLVCVVNRHQIVRFQEILQGYPGTFAYISNVNEALGNFKHITD